MSKDFLKAAITRSIRTGIQTILSMLTVGQAITDVNWHQALSVTLTAMLISFLTAILTGLPEVESDGEFIVDPNDPEGHPISINVDKDVIKNGDVLRFTVKDNTEEDE